MNLTKIPYPKASRSTFLKVSLAMALSVIFILTILQPFGTANFKHDYKYLLLSGYGAAIFVGSFFYFFIVELILSEKIKDRWSIIHEVVFVFLNVLVCLIFCYLYWSLAFRASFNINQFFYFMLSAFSIAIIPVSAYLLFIYMKYREVKMADFEVEAEETLSKLTINGTNKSEIIELDSDQLIYAESSNNYVILNIVKDDKIVRKMIRCTLNNLLSQLDDNFIKCHRSFIINKDKILNLSGNVTNSKITLSALESKIPVSRNYVGAIRELVDK